MIDLFKNWINTLLMLGIFVIILQLVIPNTNLKKYINSLIGVLVIVTILSPVYDVFKNGNLNGSLQFVASNIDEFTKKNTNNGNIEKNSNNIQNELIISSMQEKIKENILQKFSDKNIEISSIKVGISKEYEVTSIDIFIKDDIISNYKSDINQVVDNIKKEYEIEYSKISVVEDEI